MSQPIARLAAFIPFLIAAVPVANLPLRSSNDLRMRS